MSLFIISLVLIISIGIILYIYDLKLRLESSERQLNCLHQQVNDFLLRSKYYERQIDFEIPEKLKSNRVANRILNDKIEKIDKIIKTINITDLNLRVKQLENGRRKFR